MEKQAAIPLFGTPEPGCLYRIRHGAYALLANAGGYLAVVQTPAGIFLPGGGQDPGETLEETLTREVLEETGLPVEPGRCIGAAEQLALLGKSKKPVRKHCTYYLATLLAAEATAPKETDHKLRWMAVGEALTELTLGCDQWAVLRWREISRA